MFITIDDFLTTIREDKLSKITDSNPTLVDDAIRAAVAEMQSYLSSRYDVATIFETTGADRNDFLVLKCVDLALYHLYSRVSPTNIPDLRRDRYDQSLEWLKMINKGQAVLNLPLKEIGGQTAYILYGSNRPFRFR